MLIHVYLSRINKEINFVILFEGSVSQISYLGPSFYFMIKNG